MLSLQQVEQHFFACTERCLKSAPTEGTAALCLDPAAVKKSFELLTLYSNSVVLAEARPEMRRSPVGQQTASPMLLVQLRSAEALLIWIVLCLIHQCVEEKEWPGISNYRLPVQADDLRHPLNPFSRSNPSQLDSAASLSFTELG
jgi:hypothetical protein